MLEELGRLYAGARANAGRVALLWGEAGVGKTRLLEEFTLTAAAAGARVALATCFEGLCPPFAPLREAFAALSLASPFEAQRTASSSEASESLRYEAFVAASDALTGTGDPIVLLLDDIHWADFATLDFLAFLARRVEGARLLVLATVRSESLEVDHHRLVALEKIARAGVLRVSVEPLGNDDMRRLIGLLWPATADEPTDEFERIRELAEGKPYFAEELVHSAVSKRPPSIRGGVLARLEALAPEDRTLLLGASVIGRSFDETLLGGLTQETDVARMLLRARDLQLVRELAERPGLFAFRHAITREILYREMLDGQRRTIHAKLAQLLEGADEGAHAAEIADHWNAAGNAERATLAFERAGDRARANNAHRDAETAYRKALQTRDDSDATVPSLCEKFARALSINGASLAETCAYLERAVDGYAKGNNSGLAASLAIRLARRYFEAGRPADAEIAAARCLTLCNSSGAVAYEARVTLGHFAALQGRLDDAEDQLRLAEALETEPMPSHRRDFHTARALVRATSGRLRDAFDDYERAVAIELELGDPEILAWTLNNYASRALATGHSARAIAAYRHAVQVAPLSEYGKTGALVCQGLASAYLFAGDMPKARDAHARVRKSPSAATLTRSAALATEIRLAFLSDETFESDSDATAETIELAFASGETQTIGLLVGSLAAHYDAAGRTHDADALRSRALAAIASTDLSLWLLDQLALSSDDAERRRARALLAHAGRDEGNPAARAHLLLFDARVARRERKSIAAKALANEAAERFEAIGWPWERAAALEIAGRHAEAREVCRSHGYRRQLRQLEAARRRTRHRAAGDRLTPRELEVVQLAASGHSNREIAAALFISERTVETHIAAVFDRFDLTSRRELSVLASQAPPR